MRRAYPDPRLAVALRRLRSRFGISAPRVAVRTHIPWHWRILATIAVLAISIALAGWIYDAGRKIAGFDRSETEQEIAALRGNLETQKREAAKMRALANAADSNMQIERTAQEQLARQVKVLEQENGHLKEELAFFESLASAESRSSTLSINRLSVEPEGAEGRYRYRFLAVAQGDRKDREFHGQIQLVVHLQQQGKSAMMTLPRPDDPDRQHFAVDFKYFRRIEGSFQIPAGSRVTSVEARLMQNGSTRATQTVAL